MSSSSTVQTATRHHRPAWYVKVTTVEEMQRREHRVPAGGLGYCGFGEYGMESTSGMGHDSHRCRLSPGVWSNTLSSVSSEAPMWIADAASHRSPAWARSWSG